MKKKEMVITFAICVDNSSLDDFSTDDLKLGRVYEVVEDNVKQGMLRIIDDSGKDYLYPAHLFETFEADSNMVERFIHDLKTKPSYR